MERMVEHEMDDELETELIGSSKKLVCSGWNNWNRIPGCMILSKKRY